jgi:hypothetical protein
VLIVGGEGESTLFSSEVCDAQAATCSDKGFSDSNYRAGGCAALDPDTGRVLVGCASAANSTQLLDVSFSQTADSMECARRGCRCDIVGRRVILAGGEPGSCSAATRAEFFDFATGAFGLDGDLGEVRLKHTVTATLDRHVLVAGGLDSEGVMYATAHLIDAGAGEPAVRAPPLQMRRGRARHVATLLDDGTILLTGGADVPAGERGSAEIYQTPPE